MAVIIGILVGSAVNMAMIMLNSSVIPPPDGVDVTAMESLESSMHLFKPRHFVFQFLAHALGTFAGAYLAALIAANHKIKFTLIIGVFFLIGGIANTFLLPSPTWFVVLYLAGAYILMGWLGGILAYRKVEVSNTNQ